MKERGREGKSEGGERGKKEGREGKVKEGREGGKKGEKKFHLIAQITGIHQFEIKSPIQGLTHQYSHSCHYGLPSQNHSTSYQIEAGTTLGQNEGKDENLPVPIEPIASDKCHEVKQFVDKRASNDALMLLTVGEGGREGRREGGREGERKGGREGGRERGRKGGKEGEREGRRGREEWEKEEEGRIC